ncbi:hypothetical protein JW824_07315 [bacterium]|nr:hypothetical protein [bacterium]RQV95305.1 MAG: hypothetical protein EH221_06605 [bacterium]
MERRTFFQLGLTGIGAVAVANKAWALKYYPNPSDKKWAILYGTWCGTARDAGVWISEGMGGIADVFDVRENPDLSGFDHLVIGGAIRSGQVSPQLQEYLKTNREWLKEKVRGLYIVCGNMQQPVTPELVKQHIDNHLAPLCGVDNVSANVFLGRVTPRLLEPEVREMMSQFGEYDNLKRADCMALGQKILNSVE